MQEAGGMLLTATSRLRELSIASSVDPGQEQMTYLSAHTQRMELQGTAAVVAVATLIGVAFGLSTLLTPLYLIYQQAFGFSQITLTLI
jgi:hypothetical protein